MKKYILITIVLLVSISLLLISKEDKIYFIPFNIPGSQMAATIPPFGTFIEARYKKNRLIVKHEMAHWSQYRRMGFWGFYTTYLYEYIKYGRKYGPMEVEARRLSK